MKDATQRVIIRWIHIVCAIPIVGYICSPFDVIPNYAPPTRFVFHWVRRLIANRAA